MPLPPLPWSTSAQAPAQTGDAAEVPPTVPVRPLVATKTPPPPAIAEMSGVSRALSLGVLPTWYAGLENTSDGPPPPAASPFLALFWFQVTSMPPAPIMVPPTPMMYGLDVGQPAVMCLLPAPSRQPSVPVSPE